MRISSANVTSDANDSAAPGSSHRQASNMPTQMAVISTMPVHAMAVEGGAECGAKKFTGHHQEIRSADQ
jgi:hypothetical protein